MPTAYAPGFGQLEVDDLAQEGVRHLDEQPGAVAGVDLGAGRAAVVEVVQRGQRVRDDRVAAPALDVRHEGDAAGVVLVRAVVQPCGPGCRVRAGRCRHGRRGSIFRSVSLATPGA